MLLRNKCQERVERYAEFIEAIGNARTYKPKVGTDYLWVATHASEEYQRLESILDALDDKADGLIKYLGAGSGLLSLAFSPALSNGNWITALQACPTLILLVAAIFFAAQARTPGKIP